MDKNAQIEQKYPNGVWVDGLYMVDGTLKAIRFQEYNKTLYAAKVDSEGFYVPPYVKRIEIEDEISREEYEELLKRADPKCRTIEKVRYCVEYGEFEFEIDVFPFWQDKAFMEVEMPSEDTNVPLPDFVKIIREVTDDNRYTNHALAISLPE